MEREICIAKDQLKLVFATIDDKKKIYDMLVDPGIIHQLFNEEHPAPTWEEFDENESNSFFKGKMDLGGNYLLIYYHHELIGSISYTINHFKVHFSEIDLWLKKEFTKKGLGVECIKLVINHVLTHYLIHTFIIRPWVKNIYAIKAYKKCGFVEIPSFNPSLYYPDNVLEDYGPGDYGVEETINLILEVKDEI